MKYKISKYSIVADNEELVIYNSISDKPEFLKFNREDSSAIRLFLNKKEIQYVNTPIMNFLIKKDVLVDSKLNETNLVNYQYNRQAYCANELLLTIVPTDACNMRCVYCYQNHEPHFMQDSDYDAILKFIRYNMHKYKALQIGWFGGEPLLCKDKIITFLNKANEICSFLKKPIRCEMINNGLLLDIETFESLLKLGVTSYQITIDGFEATHNKQRKTNNNSNGYQTIMDNLKNIKKHCNKRFDIMLRTNFVLENADETKEFVIYLHDVFGSDNRFDYNLQSIRNWGNHMEDKINITPYENSDKLFGELLEKGVDPLSKRIADIKQICPACSASYYFINWDLSLHKCSIALHNNHKYSRIGKLSQSGGLEIDTHKESLWIERGTIPQKCLDCNYYALCFSNTCPYSYTIKSKRNCEEFIFSFNEKMKFISAKLPYVNLMEIKENERI